MLPRGMTNSRVIKCAVPGLTAQGREKVKVALGHPSFVSLTWVNEGARLTGFVFL